MMLTHRSCSTCIYWSSVPSSNEDIVTNLCEKDAKLTRGGDYCGQWKKLKYIYNRMYDIMYKDYS